MNTQYYLNKLVRKQNLMTEESYSLLVEIMKGNISPVQTAAILTALHMKGETVREIFGFIQALRENMVKIHAKNAIDVCGTGGDRKETFNISTAVAFVVTGAGVNVGKHGNRAASSKCGSADVLEELGVKIDVQPQQAQEVLEEVGMIFLFAPLYHPSLKNVGIVRKELGIRTIFNFLGPFANPGLVTRQLVGVPSLEIAEKLAEVGKLLEYEHVIIVSGEDGFDEISLSANSHMFEIKKNNMIRSIIDPEEYGFHKHQQNLIIGGDAKVNAAIILEILKGVKNERRNIVVFNSAFALYVAGKVNNIADGIKLAENSIDSGKAKKVLDQLIKETNKYA